MVTSLVTENFRTNFWYKILAHNFRTNLQDNFRSHFQDSCFKQNFRTNSFRTEFSDKFCSDKFCSYKYFPTYAFIPVFRTFFRTNCVRTKLPMPTLNQKYTAKSHFCCCRHFFHISLLQNKLEINNDLRSTLSIKITFFNGTVNWSIYKTFF